MRHGVENPALYRLMFGGYLTGRDDARPAGRIDVLMDGGIQRGSHVLKALSLGAKAVGIGRCYLYPLAAAGRAGVERALSLLRAEIVAI